MRGTLVGIAVLMLSATAHAEDDSPNTGVALGILGAAVVTYGTYQTMKMLDDDLKQGFSTPDHALPAGALAAICLIAAGALTAYSYDSGNHIGFVGGSVASVFSTFMLAVAIVSVHGWLIRQGPQHD